MATPLLSPKSGLPELIVNEKDFEITLEQIAKGFGPIAFDAERASGFKYSARAYLIQIHRRDGGLHLIDPIAIGTTNLWSELNEAFDGVEWILHASTQDLPCLNELGLRPKLLFDTELGGRIAGCERVGLGFADVEQFVQASDRDHLAEILAHIRELDRATRSTDFGVQLNQLIQRGARKKIDVA